MMSSDGRRRFLDYIGELERVVRDATVAERAGVIRPATST
jgi:hypothetical protein